MTRLGDESYKSIFRNFHEYPLRTYIFHSVYSDLQIFMNETSKQIIGTTGADGKVADLLASKMNFTMDLQWPDDAFFGTRTKNGSYDGAIGRMIRFETDIILSGFFIKDYLTRDIAFSSPVYMDELCCYVKKASRIPQSIVPLFAVKVDIWISFLFVGMLTPFMWMLLRRVNLGAMAKGSTRLKLQKLQAQETRLLTQNHKLQYLRIFIDTWVMWVRVNIVSYPPFISERIFIASLCLVSVIFGALFESSLATVYIRPLHYKDINTMKELDEANIMIYIKHGAMRDDLFYGHSSQIYQNLEKKLLLIAELEERLIHTMSRGGKFASVTRASSLELDDIHYFITKKIHKIPECPKSYHIAFVLPSNSPLEKSFNILLLKFVQAGLIDHWIADMMYNAKIKTRNFVGFLDETGDKWKVLTLNDLQLSFYTVICGSVLATIVLLLEFIAHCKKIRNLLGKIA
ncbi:glutamate receptor [Zeugodacus cucurbitae]|uniref:glutamate receptor n=1 Tax=Zeugodacus cucurbitae TaxID=28588 RepID=UPI0023D9504D|nr:glutamate receptor [Zeugodacus cucurbitae]